MARSSQLAQLRLDRRRIVADDEQGHASHRGRLEQGEQAEKPAAGIRRSGDRLPEDGHPVVQVLDVDGETGLEVTGRPLQRRGVGAPQPLHHPVLREAFDTTRSRHASPSEPAPVGVGDQTRHQPCEPHRVAAGHEQPCRRVDHLAHPPDVVGGDRPCPWLRPPSRPGGSLRGRKAAPRASPRRGRAARRRPRRRTSRRPVSVAAFTSARRSRRSGRARTARRGRTAHVRRALPRGR